MTDEIDICNRALAQVPTRTTITSLNPATDDSEEAAACAMIFESTRDQLLSMAWWNFARKTATLELNKCAPGTPEFTGTETVLWNEDFPPPPWAYEYLYPDDCIQARYIIPQPTTVAVPPAYGGGVGFAYQAFRPPRFIVDSGTVAPANTVACNVIETNAQNAILVYSFRNEDIDLWSAQFIEALVFALAGKLTIPLIGDKKQMVTNLQQANALALQARSSDGNEGLTIQDSVPDWLQIRGVGGSNEGAQFGDPPSYGSLFVIS